MKLKKLPDETKGPLAASAIVAAFEAETRWRMFKKTNRTFARQLKKEWKRRAKENKRG